MAKKIKVIVGSVRPGRAGEKVAKWVMDQSSRYTGDLSLELIDLAEINLPYMDEPAPPMMADSYTKEHTKKWSQVVAEADGFIIVTPEYNHGYSPVLKNALDYLYNEWKDKAVAFIGYGGGGAEYSIRQLTEVVEFLGMKPTASRIGIGPIWEALDDSGNIKTASVNGDIIKLFEELEQAA